MNRKDFENDEQWWKYRDYLLRNFGKFWSEKEQKFVNASGLDICYEVCPECEYEVPLENAKLKTPHKCPHCNKYIMPCNLCDDCDNSCNWQRLNRETGKIEENENEN